MIPATAPRGRRKPTPDSTVGQGSVVSAGAGRSGADHLLHEVAADAPSSGRPSASPHVTHIDIRQYQRFRSHGHFRRTHREGCDEVSQAKAAAEEEDRSTDTLDLFFDLVFVFAMSQVTDLMLQDVSWTGFGRPPPPRPGWYRPTESSGCGSRVMPTATCTCSSSLASCLRPRSQPGRQSASTGPDRAGPSAKRSVS